MAESILITCPDCKKQLKGPGELLGKKIRCKSCDHIFVVKATAAWKASADSKAGKGKPVPATKGKADTSIKAKGKEPAKPEPPLSVHQEDEDAKNPYKLTDIVVGSRCPQCAAEMEEGDIICLTCGYNTSTRTRTVTVKTFESTTMDWSLWLAPGILCVLVALASVGAIVWLWVAIGHRDENGELKQLNFAGKIWGSVVAAFIGWITGKFAFKRLVLHYRPPEKLMK